MIDFKALTRPFAPDEIEWRVGATNKDKTKGIALAYMDARAVMDRLDEVVGPENWQDRYPHAGSKTVCELGLRIEDEWVFKADGAGDTDFEAAKGALSDAFKRSAFRWGIGRYLYELDAPWVAIEQRGRSYVIRQDELEKLKRKYRYTFCWSGPLGLSELKKAVRDLHKTITQCTTREDLAEVQKSHAEIIRQCREDLVEWWDSEEYSLKSIIEKRAEDLAAGEQNMLAGAQA